MERRKTTWPGRWVDTVETRGFSSDCFYFLWEISKKWYRVWGRKWWRFGERGEDVKQSFRIMEK